MGKNKCRKNNNRKMVQKEEDEEKRLNKAVEKRKPWMLG